MRSIGSRPRTGRLGNTIAIAIAFAAAIRPAVAQIELSIPVSDDEAFDPIGPAPGPIAGRTILRLDGFEPTNGQAGVVEPLSRPSADDPPHWLLNLDVDFTNATDSKLWIDGISWSYPDPGSPIDATVSGHFLLEEFPDVPFAKKRHLFGGGWRVFGAETSLLDDSNAYVNDFVYANEAGTNGRYVVVGPRFSPSRWSITRLDGNGDVLLTTELFSELSPAVPMAIARFGNTVVAAGWVTDGGVKTVALGNYDAVDLTLNTGFGEVTENGRSGFLRILIPGAIVNDVVDVARPVTGGGWLVLADVTRNGAREMAVIRVDSQGELVPSFGQNGILSIGFELFGIPADLRADGLATALVGGVNSFYVAGSVGSNCNHGSPLPGECFMYVSRYAMTGSLDTDYALDGARLIAFDGAAREAAEALVVANDGSAYVAGWASAGLGQSSLRWAAAKLTPDGDYDPHWGQGGDLEGFCLDEECGKTGRVMHTFGTSRGVIRALALRGNELVAGGWALNEAGRVDFAIGVYSSSGEAVWGRMAFRELPDFEGWAQLNTIAVDRDNQVVAAGSSNRSLYGDPGDFWATARFTEDGHLDTRLLLQPGASRELKLPEWREFDGPPSEVRIDVAFRNSALVESFVIPLSPHQSADPAGGNYIFPLTGLGVDEYFATGQHHILGSNHRQSRSQRFAYDFGAAYVNPANGSVRSTHLDGNGEALPRTENANYIVWGKRVRAAADGVVLECYSLFPDNEKPGVEDEAVKAIAGGGNMFWIRHSNGEVALYAHLQAGTVPAALCPTPASGKPEDQGAASGGAFVSQGTELGRVGSSGASTGPHLHFHVQRGVPDTIDHEGLPVLFGNRIQLIRKKDLQDGLTDFANPNAQAVPYSSYVRGMD